VNEIYSPKVKIALSRNLPIKRIYFSLSLILTPPSLASSKVFYSRTTLELRHFDLLPQPSSPCQICNDIPKTRNYVPNSESQYPCATTSPQNSEYLTFAPISPFSATCPPKIIRIQRQRFFEFGTYLQPSNQDPRTNFIFSRYLRDCELNNSSS
jgi:hypothetical protein